MTIERERKLAVLDDFHLPPLEGVANLRPVPLPTEDLRTVYVDTADLRLLRWGCTLRQREGEGWTLKLPLRVVGGELQREERPLPGGTKGPSAEAKELVQAFTRGAALRPILRLRTRREGFEMVSSGDLVGARVVHDRVTVLAGGKVVGRFAEVEVEAGGAQRVNGIPQILAELGRAGAVDVVTATKLQRALSAAGLELPDPAIARSARRDEDVLGMAIAGSVTRLIRSDPDVRIGEDPEAVHQARVAVRRLRSDLRSFGHVLDGSADIRRELGWLADGLGAVRDLDVLLERLERERTEAPATLDDGLGEVVAQFRAQRAAARAALLSVLRSRRYWRLLDDLEDLASSAQVRIDTAALVPADVMEPGWRRLRRAVADAGATPTDGQLHRIRILAKRVRYSAEALVASVGRPAGSFANDAARLQDVLGAHQDAVVAGSRLAAVAEVADPRTAYAAGWLAGRTDAVRAGAQSDWRKAWKALNRKKRRFW